MPRDHQYFVYIVEKRIWEHNEGVHSNSFTFKRRPVVLRYYQRFTNVNHAIEWEKQVKGWGRKKKEALFIEDWNEIVRLSNYKRGNQSSTGSD